MFEPALSFGLGVGCEPSRSRVAHPLRFFPLWRRYKRYLEGRLYLFKLGARAQRFDPFHTERARVRDYLNL